jgi:hypothetical protein
VITPSFIRLVERQLKAEGGTAAACGNAASLTEAVDLALHGSSCVRDVFGDRLGAINRDRRACGRE